MTLSLCMSMFKLDDTEAAENVYYFGVLRFRLLMCDHELFSRHSHTLRPFYVRAMRAAQSFFSCANGGWTRKGAQTHNCVNVNN